MVRVSSPAKLRLWSELTAKMVMGVVPGLVSLVAQSSATGVTVAAIPPPCRAIRFRNPKCRDTLHQPAAPRA